MKHCFFVKNLVKSKIHCDDCRQKFESHHHWNHRLLAAALCPDPYAEPSEDPPNMLLQNMLYDVLYIVADFLLFKDLANYICALPRLLVCHGMKTLWAWRMNRHHLRFGPHKMNVSIYWLIANKMKLLHIGHFITIRSQGRISRDDGCLEAYHRFLYLSDRLKYGCRHAWIWHLHDYVKEYREVMAKPGPLQTSVLF